MGIFCYLFGCNTGWDHSMAYCSRCNTYILKSRHIDDGLFMIIKDKINLVIYQIKKRIK